MFIKRKDEICVPPPSPSSPRDKVFLSDEEDGSQPRKPVFLRFASLFCCRSVAAADFFFFSFFFFHFMSTSMSVYV